MIALEESLTTSLVLGRQEGEGADYREYLSEGLILEGLRKVRREGGGGGRDRGGGREGGK